MWVPKVKSEAPKAEVNVNIKNAETEELAEAEDLLRKAA